MNLSDAILLLGVPEGAGEAEIDAAFLAKSSDLRARIEGAPTDALRAKYEQQLVSLGAARDALLAAASVDAGGDADAPVVSQTMADLPQAVPSYTPAPDGASPGEGLVLEPGTLLAGRYEVKERIGAGGMGAVFRVLDRTRGKDIAIKAMLPSLLENEKAKARFLNEARLSSDLSHPNIVNVYDVQEAESLTFLTMELLEGQSLRDYLKVHTRGLEVAEAVRIAVAVGEALAYAHGSTIHRDVKPENVFICEDGAIKLLDFGIAQVQSTSQLTKTGAAMGTAYYMAPEQLKGARDVDGRADQYALGVMLYEMLTAEIPQGRFADPHKVNREVPKKLSQAIVRAMEIAPDKRYGSIGDFLKAVSGKGRVAAASGGGSGSSGGGGSMMPKVVAALGVAAVVALLVLYGGPLKDAVMEMIPDAEQEAQLEARALTLDGVVKGLQRRLEAAQRTLETTVRDGQSEVRRLEGNVRSARSDNDRRRAETALSRAEEQLQLAEEHSDAARDAVFGSPDILAVDGQLSVAASRLRDKRYGEAATDLAAVEAVLTAKLALIDDAGDMVRARMAARTALADWRAVLADLPADSFPVAVAAVDGLETEARQQQASWEFRAADETWRGIIDRTNDLLPEAQAWAKALNTGRSADYQAYLSGWPAGVYAEDATSRGQTAQSSEQRAAARRRDNADWATAQAADNTQSYQVYLKAHPSGAHATEAQQGLKAAEERLTEEGRLAAIKLAGEKLGEQLLAEQPAADQRLAEHSRQDEAAWAAARLEGWVSSYQTYLQVYPQGTYVAEAEAGLQIARQNPRTEALQEVEAAQQALFSLLRKKREEARPAADQDERAWAFASATNSLSSLQGYLAAWPNGQHAAEARQSLEKMAAVTISAGGFHTCAVKGDGAVMCWGSNVSGQANVPAAARSGVTAVSAGTLHSCALTGSGGVKCWGWNGFGQTTVPSGAQSGITKIATGTGHSCALKGTGEVLCWGANFGGQIEVPADAKSGVTAIAVGGSHSCALKGGGVLCWGDNSTGQTALPAGAHSNVTGLAAGGGHACALKGDGAVLCWGDNTFGQTDISSGARSGIAAIAAGHVNSCALKRDSGLLCWGGNNQAKEMYAASRIDQGVTAMAISMFQICAVKSGGVLCWGINKYAQAEVPAQIRVVE